MIQRIVQAQDQYISDLETKNAKLEEMVKRAEVNAPRSPAVRVHIIGFTQNLIGRRNLPLI